MTRRALITLIVTLKLLVVAASAAVATQPNVDAPDTNWDDPYCQPWEGCEGAGGS